MKQRFEPAVPIDDLLDHPDNPRLGDADTVRESIRTHGFYGAVVVQESSRRIIAGHNRRRQARAVGEETVPVLWLDVDDDTARRIMLVDNRSNDKADYDDRQLADLLTELAGLDGGLIGTGFTDEDMADLLAMVETPTLDELGDRHGEHDPADLWPVLRFKVPPDVKDRYARLVADVPGGDADQFAWLLDQAGADAQTPPVAL
jgi:ParB-like chromosome segregation protein Spo0J